jgi:TRAP-type C4-dicarboxylate transport system substrate-binding protein
MPLIKRTFLVTLVALGLASCEPSEILVIRIGSHVPEQSVGIRTVLKPWIEAVEKQLPPNIRFQTYWGGSLGRDAFIQYDLVRHGVLDIAWVIPSYTPGQFPQMDLMQLPFLAKTATEASVMGWRLEEAGLIQGTDHIKVLGIWTTDIASLLTREVVSEFSQVKNFKIRSAGAVHASFIEAIGANPETMSAPEMNEALQRGAIDGVLQAWSGVRTYRSDRLLSSSLEGPFGALPFMLLMNRASFERLPAPVQEIFMSQGGEYLARRAGEAYDRMAIEIIEDIEAGGRHTIVEQDPELTAQYRRQYAHLHQTWINKTNNGAEAYALGLKVLEELRDGDE